MILITTRLGLIACRYLVESYSQDRYVSAPEIAEHYNMNVRALMPALRLLTRAGILRSRVGGSTPGFIFSRDPSKYSMLRILNVLEGEVKFECCKDLVHDLKCDCSKNKQCGVYSLFDGVLGDIAKSLSKISIVDHARGVESGGAL